MINVISDKVDFCKKYNIEIKKEDWDCDKIPHKLLTDKGKEYSGEVFTQLTDYGIEIINLAPYRPEMKGAVEKFFDIIKSYYVKELYSKGLIFKDFRERGGKIIENTLALL